MNIEISDLYGLIRGLQKDLFSYSFLLSRLLLPQILYDVQKYFYKPFINCRNRNKSHHEKKFIWLSNIKNADILRKIKPINYVCKTDNRGIIVDIFNSTPQHLKEDTYSIEINPQEFEMETKNLLYYTNEKWFLNITGTAIPLEVSNLLQMESNFCLPTNLFKKTTTYGFIKDLENDNNIQRVRKLAQIRNMAIPLLWSFSEGTYQLSPTEKHIAKSLTRR